MKSSVKFVEKFGAAFLSFNNGVVDMHHDFFVGSFAAQFKHLNPPIRRAQKQREVALRCALELQPLVDEALSLMAPDGYVFGGIAQKASDSLVIGFRRPKRAGKAEKHTDSRLGRADWMLYRLSAGRDAIFVPLASDWSGSVSPRGCTAHLTAPHQLTA